MHCLRLTELRGDLDAVLLPEALLAPATLNLQQRRLYAKQPDSPAHIRISYSDARRLNKGSLFIPGDTRFDGLFVGFQVRRHIFQLT